MTKLAFDILTTFDPRGTKQASDNLDKLGKSGKRAGDEVGKGYARGTKRAGKSLGELEGKAKQSGRKAGDEAGKNFGVGFSKNVKGIRVGSFLKTGAGAAAGLGAGLAFADAFGGALERGDSKAMLAARLGLTGEESAHLGKIAGDLYASNYGESVGDVSGVIHKVIQDTNTAVKSADLAPITQQVISLGKTFEQDFGQITRAAGQMVRTGLAKDTQSALDILTTGLQKGADKSEDFLDTFNEYGTLFRNMGLSGAQATGLIAQGLQAGARDADKVADAIKEFSIRAVDGSKLTGEGFKALGLDAEAMATKIGRGGESASGALDLTLDKLRGIKDPVKRAETAVALFGTQAEDLGDALFALDATKAVGELGKVGGAAKKVDTTISNTHNGAWKTFRRGLEEDFTHSADIAIEAFSGLAAAITGNDEAFRNAGDNIRSSFENMFGEENTEDMLGFGDSFKTEMQKITDLAKQKRVVTLRGDIKDLDRKIRKGEREIKDVPKSKQTDFKADIADLKRKRKQAQDEINKLKGKTVTVKLKAPGFVQDLISGNTNLLPLGGGRAAGGIIPGPSSNVDNHLRPMATGEFVVRANKVNARTLPVLDMINQKGIPPQGLAEGGLVTRANYLGSPGLPAIGAYAGLIQGTINRIASAIEKKASSFAGGAGSALGFAKAQVGKPYVWGGVGPGGYDCSGFMSAILNVLQGRNPYSRRGTTASFPWSGFSPGMGSFAVGSTKNAGGGIGHMAGTLFGVPVESRGGVGPIVGSGALSATSGLFGGPWSVKKFDQGGQLKPGVTLAVNNTGRNETVLPNSGAVRLHPDDLRTLANLTAEAQVRKLSERGKFLAAVDSGKRADLFSRGG